MSGFCIHLSFQQQGRKWDEFFIRRFFRIYPAYLAALIFSILLIAAHSQLNFRNRFVLLQWLTNLFLVHNFNPLTIFGINSSFWTLAVEVQLYLLYPALLLLASRLGWRRTMVILAGCELLTRSAAGFAQLSGSENTLRGRMALTAADSPLGYWFSWSLGAFIAEAFLENQPLPFHKTSPAPWLALAIVSYFMKPLYPFLFLLFAVAAAVIMSRLLGGASGHIKIPAAGLTLLKKFGLWSQSIYLLHEPLLNLCTDLIIWAVPRAYRSALTVFLLILAGWLAVITFNVLWYKIFELPGIALGKRLIQKRAVHVPTIAGPEKIARC